MNNALFVKRLFFVVFAGVLFITGWRLLPTTGNFENTLPIYFGATTLFLSGGLVISWAFQKWALVKLCLFLANLTFTGFMFSSFGWKYATFFALGVIAIYMLYKPRTNKRVS